MQRTLSANPSKMNSVLKNAFMGVGIELSVYSLAMYIGMTLGIGNILFALGALVIIFILPKFADSMAGFGLANLMAALLGLSAAPVLQMYLDGGFINEIFIAAVATAAITYALSIYAMTTSRDFSFMGGFLVAALIGLIVVGIMNIFIQSTILSLVGAYAGVLIFSGFIMYDVNTIVKEKQGNWIMASVGLFLSIINLFWSILRILGIFSSD